MPCAPSFHCADVAGLSAVLASALRSRVITLYGASLMRDFSSDHQAPAEMRAMAPSQQGQLPLKCTGAVRLHCRIFESAHILPQVFCVSASPKYLGPDTLASTCALSKLPTTTTCYSTTLTLLPSLHEPGRSPWLALARWLCNFERLQPHRSANCTEQCTNKTLALCKHFLQQTTGKQSDSDSSSASKRCSSCWHPERAGCCACPSSTRAFRSEHCPSLPATYSCLSHAAAK